MTVKEEETGTDGPVNITLPYDTLIKYIDTEDNGATTWKVFHDMLQRAATKAICDAAIQLKSEGDEVKFLTPLRLIRVRRVHDENRLSISPPVAFWVAATSGEKEQMSNRIMSSKVPDIEPEAI